MTFTVDFLLSAMVALGSGVGSYVAIRVDLARITERVSRAQADADRALERLNAIAIADRRSS